MSGGDNDSNKSFSEDLIYSEVSKVDNLLSKEKTSLLSRVRNGVRNILTRRAYELPKESSYDLSNAESIASSEPLAFSDITITGTEEPIDLSGFTSFIGNDDLQGEIWQKETTKDIIKRLLQLQSTGMMEGFIGQYAQERIKGNNPNIFSEITIVDETGERKLPEDRGIKKNNKPLEFILRELIDDLHLQSLAGSPFEKELNNIYSKIDSLVYPKEKSMKPLSKKYPSETQHADLNAANSPSTIYLDLVNGFTNKDGKPFLEENPKTMPLKKNGEEFTAQDFIDVLKILAQKRTELRNSKIPDIFNNDEKVINYYQRVVRNNLTFLEYQEEQKQSAAKIDESRKNTFEKIKEISSVKHDVSDSPTPPPVSPSRRRSLSSTAGRSTVTEQEVTEDLKKRAHYRNYGKVDSAFQNPFASENKLNFSISGEDIQKQHVDIGNLVKDVANILKNENIEQELNSLKEGWELQLGKDGINLEKITIKFNESNNHFEFKREDVTVKVSYNEGGQINTAESNDVTFSIANAESYRIIDNIHTGTLADVVNDFKNNLHKKQDGAEITQGGLSYGNLRKKDGLAIFEAIDKTKYVPIAAGRNNQDPTHAARPIIAIQDNVRVPIEMPVRTREPESAITKITKNFKDRFSGSGKKPEEGFTR